MRVRREESETRVLDVVLRVIVVTGLAGCAVAVVCVIVWLVAALVEGRRDVRDTMRIDLHGSPVMSRFWTVSAPGSDEETERETVPPADDRACPDCQGTRCWSWRDSGHRRGCDNRNRPGNGYVNLEQSIREPGRHDARLLTRWVPGDWSPLPLETRVFLAPTFWQRRLPVLAGGEV